MDGIKIFQRYKNISALLGSVLLPDIFHSSKADIAGTIAELGARFRKIHYSSKLKKIPLW